MKRTFRTLLVLCCLALCITFCLTACSDKCEHSYDNDCDAICNECEETREVGAHDWSVATCTEKAKCTACGTAYGTVDANNHIDENTDHICDRECGKTDIGTHADSENDDDHTCDYGCGATLEDCKGGTATCVNGKVCEICGVEYDTTKNPDNHTSTEFTYTDNLDGTHTKAHKCCEVEIATEKHTFDASNKCLCGVASLQIEQVIMSNLGNPFGGGWDNDNEIDLRVIGTQNRGKTAWAVGDQIIITLTSKYYGIQTCAITCNGAYWDTEVSFSYLEGETPTVSVIYAPCYKADGTLQDGMQLGMTEYLVGEYEIGDGFMNVSFANATRNYSRLRISALPGQTLTVITTDFAPAGATSTAIEPYTITADEDGNADLYGTFAVDATVSVKKGEVTLVDYTFTAEKHPEGIEKGISYALDARPIIDGTLGGDTDVTEEDIAALVEQIKTYVDNGITTIIVTGSNPAKITVNKVNYSYTTTAIGEAIYRLSGSGTYDADNQYNGKIDLILPDVTEIIGYEYQNAYALNSITLPKVTKLGTWAFNNCQYLKKITFGSVVTEGSPNAADFQYVGEAVGGCHLVLNRGQASAAAEYLPDLNGYFWWALTKWNYIELI